MKVKRVVANIATDRAAEAKAFYSDLLGMRVAMDQGWIVTLAGEGAALPQISLMREGGSGAPVPDLSIEVEYGPAEEPWGVSRFFVRDPCGRLVNILAHR
jgi:hypothetical protein